MIHQPLPREGLRKRKTWQRERMVSKSFSSSVVARMNSTWAGGSSSVFRSALKASLVSMWTSSMMYTLYLDSYGSVCTASLSSRTSSIPRLLAASISYRSTLLVPTAFAKIRAKVVLPVPRVPENKRACGISPFLIAPSSTFTMCSWSRTSLNSCGRYFRYKAPCSAIIFLVYQIIQNGQNHGQKSVIFPCLPLSFHSPKSHTPPQLDKLLAALQKLPPRCGQPLRCSHACRQGSRHQ